MTTVDRSDPFGAWQTARAALARRGAVPRELTRCGREVVECEYPDGTIVILGGRVSIAIKGQTVDCMCLFGGAWAQTELSAAVLFGVCDELRADA